MSDLSRIVEGRVVPAAGSWKIDAGHSNASFAVRHLLTLLRGRFRRFEGWIEIAEDPTDSTVSVVFDATSIDTTNEKVDASLRSDKFLDVGQHPKMTFVSTQVTPEESGRWVVTGDLTIAGIARSVHLDTEFVGAVTSPIGGLKKMSFAASTQILREDFGMMFTAPSPDTQGVWVVGNKIDITLDVEADLDER